MSRSPKRDAAAAARRKGSSGDWRGIFGDGVTRARTSGCGPASPAVTCQIDPAAHAVATEYLESTLDALNQMNDDPGSDYGGDFNAIPNFNSHLQL